MWMISGPPQSSEDFWIEVNDSQRKFEVHREDLNDTTFDTDRLTFEVISWSRKPACSSLYTEFLPILEHRGVSRVRLEAFVASCMDRARDDVEDAVYDRVSNGSRTTFKWIKDNFQMDQGQLRLHYTNDRGCYKATANRQSADNACSKCLIY